MDHKHVLQQIQDYVLAFYKEHDTSKFAFHNVQHTQNVVLAATRIAKHYVLDEKDEFVVLAAAWFHDLGYLVTLNDHEDESVTLAETFLEEHKTGHGTQKAIKACILATRMPQNPQNLPEQILCDADLFHLGTKDFFAEDSLLFKEQNLLHETEIDKVVWLKKTLGFLEAHTYQTDYCQRQLGETIEKNIDKLKKNIAKEEKETPAADAAPAFAPAAEGKPKPGKVDKSNIPDKGIETMFRVSSSNHQRLSDMADKKAHIMITVNSIILSAVISLVLRRLDQYGYLIIPTFILLTISLLAMTFSILSTRPSIPNGTFSKADLDNRKVNLLFFGNFYKMRLDDFNEGMEIMMEDKKFLYHSLIKDLYAQGVVLGKKYHLLHIAYNIFMFGLIVSVVAFIIASAFFRH